MTPGWISRSKWLWLALAACFLAVGIWACMHQDELLAQYEAWKLSRASESQRPKWVARLALRGEAAIDALLSYLHGADPVARERCSFALQELASQWTAASPDTRQLARRLVADFEVLSDSSRREALFIAVATLTMPDDAAPPPELSPILAHLLENAELLTAPETRPGSLLFAIRFVNQTQAGSEMVLKTCRALAAAGLSDDRAECRAHGARLAAAPGMNLLHLVPPLVLGGSPDPDPGVRRTALVLIGQSEALAPTEGLLLRLHDRSGEVRSVCAKILRSRGLSVEQIDLARLMTDPDATVRARVPARVLDFPDLDTHVWLDRLSRDSSPAVRAAVVRTFGDLQQLQLRDRVREMAGDDPSSTIRQLADYYLTRRRP